MGMEVKTALDKFYNIFEAISKLLKIVKAQEVIF